MDGVVPLAMEFVTGDAEAGHLLIGYDNSLWIGARVEFAADGKPGLCCGGADEIDDHTIADQRLRLPVHRDEREQAVLHLVPFARTRRQVVNGDVDAQLVGKTLEFKLPQPHARAIAAAAIGGDGQPGGAGIAQTTNLLPPAADRLNRERRRVAAHANAHPAGIGCEIVDAIRHRPAEFLDQEVMHPDLLRVTLRTPVPTGVLEVSDQLFFLSVDRDHRLARRQCGPHALIEMIELRIAVWVALPLARLAVALQAELLLVQQFTNQGVRPTRWPMAAKACVNCDRLLQVQRSGDIGSPRASGSTSASKSPSSVVSCITRFLPPPPGRRTRPGSSSSAATSSFKPRPIVLAAIPVPRDSAAMPP